MTVSTTVDVRDHRQVQSNTCGEDTGDMETWRVTVSGLTITLQG